MSTDLLFEQFATLATAPDGIARLRELILQLAVQGKLGTQDAGDEPASVLLKRIEKKKEQLAKEGKFKKQQIHPPISDEIIPFTIPTSWEWVRLGDIFEITSSRRVHEIDWKTSGIPFLRARELVSLKKRRDLQNSDLYL